MHHRIITILLALTSTSFFSANQHLQTSADPKTKDLVIELPDNKLTVNLETGNPEIIKYPNGAMKELRFRITVNKYVVYFHPEPRRGREQVKRFQMFRKVNNLEVPDGEWLSFSQEGTMLTRQNWKAGKLHGVQEVYNDLGIIISHQEYEEGLPVGTWSQYYVDGTLATTIDYPASATIWKESQPEQALTADQKPQSVLDVPFYSSLQAKEICYSPTGNKQRERLYRLYANADGSFFKEPIGVETAYYPDGTIRQQARRTGTVETVTSFPTVPMPHRVEERWIQGKKHSAIAHPLNSR